MSAANDLITLWRHLHPLPSGSEFRHRPTQFARDGQYSCELGPIGRSLSIAPAGITASRPLRVIWGSGVPQTLQTDVAKLLALGKSHRFTSSSPDIHRNCRCWNEKSIRSTRASLLSSRPTQMEGKSHPVSDGVTSNFQTTDTHASCVRLYRSQILKHFRFCRDGQAVVKAFHGAPAGMAPPLDGVSWFESYGSRRLTQEGCVHRVPGARLHQFHSCIRTRYRHGHRVRGVRAASTTLQRSVVVWVGHVAMSLDPHRACCASEAYMGFETTHCSFRMLLERSTQGAMSQRSRTRCCTGITSWRLFDGSPAPWPTATAISTAIATLRRHQAGMRCWNAAFCVIT